MSTKEKQEAVRGDVSTDKILDVLEAWIRAIITDCRTDDVEDAVYARRCREQLLAALEARHDD